MAKALLFLGAGASYQFDKPTTVMFKEELQKNGVLNDPIAYSFLRAESFEDIEHVLQAMKEVRESMSPASKYPYAGKYLLSGKPVKTEFGDFKKTFQYLRSKINEVENQINQIIFSRYDWDNSQNKKLETFYCGLFGLLREKSPEIYIGTTNYDQAIENFCMLPGNDYVCVDGFDSDEKGTAIWKRENFLKKLDSPNEIPVYLYKIHGSLNWEWDGRQHVKTKSKPNFDGPSGSNVYIAPTISPKSQAEREPYKTINEEFERNLLESELCIVIGFSFRDEHITEKFKKFLDSGKTLVIVSPNGKLDYSKNFVGNEWPNDETHVNWVNSNKPKTLHFIQNYVKSETNDDVFSSIKKIISTM